jgi:hypothetical protein
MPIQCCDWHFAIQKTCLDFITESIIDKVVGIQPVLRLNLIAKLVVEEC